MRQGLPQLKPVTTLAPKWLVGLLVMLFAGASGADESSARAPEPLAAGQFKSLFEPSGITLLPDGTLLIVNDEPDQPLHRVELTGRGEAAHLVEHDLPQTSSVLRHWLLGPLDDLEGATRDRNGRIYVIGSHDDANERSISDRQKLVRFAWRDQALADVRVKRTLGQELLQRYPELAERPDGKARKSDDNLNIEGLAYDLQRQTLLIALRSPLVAGQAVIVQLLNPDAWFDDQAAPEFSPALWSLALDGGGLRALSYDQTSDRLFLVSRAEKGKHDEFRLWTVPADGHSAAVQVLPGADELFDSVEGVMVLDPDGGGPVEVLFVRDDGNRKKRRGGRWFVLSAASMKLQP